MSKDTMNDVNMPQPLDNDDRYLWDKSGPVDREIEQLERFIEEASIRAGEAITGRLDTDDIIGA